MSIIRIVGCEEETRRRLAFYIQSDLEEIADLRRLPMLQANDEIWIVCIAAVAEYREALLKRNLSSPRKPPKRTLLWVPTGQKELPFAVWSEIFALQLQEAREADHAQLKRFCENPHFLDWSERVARVPLSWFTRLRVHPKRLALDDFPLSRDEKRRLKRDVESQDWVRLCLGSLAETHWALICPSVEEITSWLESNVDNRHLEARIEGCGLAHETARRHIQLWEAGELITPEQAETKRAAIGLVFGRLPTGWATADLMWPKAFRQSLDKLAVLMANALNGGPVSLAERTSSNHGELSQAELADYLSDGGAVNLVSDGKWFVLRIEDQALLVRAGTSLQHSFSRFRVEFWEGTTRILSVSAESGVARLTKTHFAQARHGQANRIVVVPEGEA